MVVGFLHFSGRGRRPLRELNEGRSSGAPPFNCTPARSSPRRARSWYFIANAFSRSDTDRYPTNLANSWHLRDIALSRAAATIASRWLFVTAIDVLGTARLTDLPSRGYLRGAIRSSSVAAEVEAEIITRVSTLTMMIFIKDYWVSENLSLRSLVR